MTQTIEISHEKAENLAQFLFSLMLESECTEAECAYAAISAIAMRSAAASRSIEQLNGKIAAIPAIFDSYYRVNMSGLQSAMLAKEAALKESH